MGRNALTVFVSPAWGVGVLSTAVWGVRGSKSLYRRIKALAAFMTFEFFSVEDIFSGSVVVMVLVLGAFWLCLCDQHVYSQNRCNLVMNTRYRLHLCSMHPEIMYNIPTRLYKERQGHLVLALSRLTFATGSIHCRVDYGTISGPFR